MFRRVPGSVNSLQRDVAEGNDVAVFHTHSTVEGASVGPVGATFVRYQNLRTGASGKLAGAGKVVGVNVGFGDGRDGHPVLGGDLKINVEVAAGVNNDRFAFGLATDEVASLSEVGVIDAFEKHVYSSECSLCPGEGRR